MPELEDLDPTSEQIEVIEAMRANEDALIKALAGTGKTTTLAMGSFAARPRRGVYWVFNAEAGRQARGVFPGRVRATTMHAYAKGELTEVGDSRIERFDAERVPPWEYGPRIGIRTEEWITDKRFTTNKLAVLAKRMVQRFCWSEDTEIGLQHVPFVRGIEYCPRLGRYEDYHDQLAAILLEPARKYWLDVSTSRGRFPVEHDHYLKFWALEEHQVPCDFMLLDEAQDLNGVNIGIVWAQRDCQLVVVGDAYQQIYEWRGARNAMDTFANLENVCALTKSYRFGPELAELANVLLESLGSDIMLEGNELRSTKLGPIDGVPDAILTRTNAGGLEELIELRKNHGDELRVGISDHMKGLRSFFEGVGALEAGKPTNHPDLVGFESWTDVLAYVADTDDADFKLRTKLVQEYGIDTLIELLGDAVAIRPDVVISTGHTAKGLEWDRVRLGADFALDPTKPISPAEIRLRYVACTRAKRALDPSAIWGGEEWDTNTTPTTAANSDAGTSRSTSGI